MITHHGAAFGYLGATAEQLAEAARLAQRGAVACPVCGGPTITDGVGRLCGEGHYSGGPWRPMTLAWGDVLYRELDKRIPPAREMEPGESAEIAALKDERAAMGEVIEALQHELRLVRAAVTPVVRFVAASLTEETPDDRKVAVHNELVLRAADVRRALVALKEDAFVT